MTRKKWCNTHIWLILFIVFLLLAIGYTTFSFQPFPHGKVKEGFDISGLDGVSNTKFQCVSSFNLEFPTPLPEDLKIVKEILEKCKSDNEDSINALLVFNRDLMKKIGDLTTQSVKDYVNDVVQGVLKILNTDDNATDDSGVNAFKKFVAYNDNFSNTTKNAVKQYFHGNMPSQIEDDFEILAYKNTFADAISKSVDRIQNSDVTKEEAVQILIDIDKNVRLLGKLNCETLDDIMKQILVRLPRILPHP